MKRVFSGLFRKTEGPRPLRHLRGSSQQHFSSRECLRVSDSTLFLSCDCVRVWYGYEDLSAERQTFGFVRRKANFLWKFLFAGTTVRSVGALPHRCAHRKDFSRGKVPCGGTEGRLAARQMDRGTDQQTSNTLQSRKRVPTKTVSTLNKQ